MLRGYDVQRDRFVPYADQRWLDILVEQFGLPMHN
jgi:hypothetical protein